MTDTPQTAAFADEIARILPTDGLAEVLPGIFAVRRSMVSDVFAHSLYRPALCLVAQGAKRVFLNDVVYEYNPQQFIVFAIDMPLASCIERASAAEPYLGVRVDFDPARVAELARHVFPSGIPQLNAAHAIQQGPMDEALVESATRLLRVVGRPEEERLFGELYTTELLLRLLRSPAGPTVAQIGVRDSRMSKVSDAISHIRLHFTQPLDVTEAATRAYMSVSSFHQHFKAATSMSPLQYQKVLRLQEARRLLLATDMDAQHVAFTVGYQSVSQFSREYRRQFGNAPTQDSTRLRAASGRQRSASVEK